MDKYKQKETNRNKCIIIAEQQKPQHELPSTTTITTTTKPPTTAANLERDDSQPTAMKTYDNVNGSNICLKSKKLISNNMELSEVASGMELNEIETLDYGQFAHDACLNSSRFVDDDINLFEIEGAGDCLMTIACKNLESRLSRNLSTISEAYNEVEYDMEKTIAKDSINQNNDKKSLTISQKPSCSSKGFENTFSLLQQQLVTRKSELSFENSQEKSICKAFHEIEEFELEFLARERLLALWNELDEIVNKECWHFTQKELEENLLKMSAPSLLPLLYDFTMAKEVLPTNYRTVSEHNKFERLKLMCNIKREQSADIHYHATVDAKGKKCLHVLRPSKTLNDEQGKIYFKKNI